MSKLLLRSPSLASAIRQVSGDGVHYHAFPSIRLSPDGSHLYCVYKVGTHTQSPPQDVYFIKRAIAFDSAWSTPVKVMEYDAVNGRAPTDPDLLVTSTGRIIVTTTFQNDGGSAYRKPHLVYSDDGGTNWTTVGEITSKFSGFDSPCKAVEIDGTIYLAHYGQEPGDSGYRIGLTKSANDGTAWSAGSLLFNGNSFASRQFEEPGIRVLPGGSVAVAMRVDFHWQTVLSVADSIGGTWRVPFGFAAGCGKADFGVFPGGEMLFCQRHPINGVGGQAVVFYTAKIGSDGVIAVSKAAYLDPLAQLGTTRRQMYGGVEVLSATKAIAVWATDDGTNAGEATIYEAEVSIA